MTETPEHTRQDEHDAHGAFASQEAAATDQADDQAHRTSPPGNPATDREAVEKGEENLGRVTGR